MDITCPNCAIKFPLIAGMNDSDARRVAALLGELPPKLTPLLLEYLSLFKPPKAGLTWRRTHTLLSELLPAIKSGQISCRGRPWAVLQTHWQQALQDVIDRRHTFTLPLKSHGYLLDVLSGLADKAEAEAERQREAQRRHRPTSQQGAHNAHIQALNADLRHFTQLYDMAPTEALKRQIERLNEQLDIRTNDDD